MATDRTGRLRTRAGIMIAAGVLLAGALSLAQATTTTSVASAATTVLNPVADSQVQADAPSTNFGTATSLRIDGSPVSVAYLKFDVQGLAAAPAKATLKVFVPISTGTAINASRVTDTSW